MESQLHKHFDIHNDPSCSLQTTFSIGLEPQKQWFQKKLKSAERGGRSGFTSPSLEGGGGGHGVPANAEGTRCISEHEAGVT